MKYLLALLLIICVGSAQAESGFYFNPDRNGEGIILTIDKDSRLAWAFFTYWDDKISVPPVVSPPPPPPPFVVITPQLQNQQTWLIGNGVYLDNIAIGKAWISKAISYPNVVGESLDEKITVGNFLIEGFKGGFYLSLDCNNLLPKSIYMCSNTYKFTRKIIGE
jgi:hypothetical protein